MVVMFQGKVVQPGAKVSELPTTHDNPLLLIPKDEGMLTSVSLWE